MSQEQRSIHPWLVLKNGEVHEPNARRVTGITIPGADDMEPLTDEELTTLGLPDGEHEWLREDAKKIVAKADLEMLMQNVAPQIPVRTEEEGDVPQQRPEVLVTPVRLVFKDPVDLSGQWRAPAFLRGEKVEPEQEEEQPSEEESPAPADDAA